MAEANRAPGCGDEPRLLGISFRPRWDESQRLVTHVFDGPDEAMEAVRAAEVLGLGVRLTNEQQISVDELTLRWQLEVWSDAFEPGDDDGAVGPGEVAGDDLDEVQPIEIAADRAERRRRFGNALASALSNQGRRQVELAEALGTTQPAISAWITGRSEPAADLVFACEVVTGVGPGALSRHLGYLPLDAVGAPPRVEDLVANSDQLDDDGKHLVLTAWRAAVRHARELRAMGATPVEDLSEHDD